MHTKLFRTLLLLACRAQDRVVILTDGDRHYTLKDIYPDDKNAFIYIEIEREP